MIHLNDEIKDEVKMSKNEVKNEKPHKIVYFVEEILKFIEKHQNQEGKGLKILTPQQMLSRLPISLAQVIRK